MKFKNVIFDVDGVIVDSETYYYEMRLTYLRQVGFKISDQESRQQIGSNMNTVLKSLLPHATSKEYQQLKLGYQNFKSENPIAFEERLNPEAVTLLQFLTQQDFQIGLASAAQRPMIMQMLAQTHLEQYFNVIVSGAEIAANKPAPDVYLEALAKLQASAQETFAIEDSAVGIQAAKAAGLTVFALAPFDKRFEIDQSQADYQINSLLEVIPIIKNA